MSRLIEILSSRESQICGYFARTVEVDRLERLLGDLNFGEYLEIYRRFPVCGMTIAFEAEQAGHITAPSPEFLQPYDPARDHELYWCRPNNVAERILCDRGRVVLEAGFLPLGEMTIGGDEYHLALNERNQFDVYQIYDDWVDWNAAIPVPPEARGFVGSFEDMLRVARFDKGYSEM